MSALPFEDESQPQPTHRLLPCVPDAERSLLGAFLIAPREVGNLCAERGLEARHFHVPAHALIYSTILGMWTDGKELDPVVVTEDLRMRGRLQEVGGPAAVSALWQECISPRRAVEYLDDIEQVYLARELIRIGYSASCRGYEEAAEIRTTIDDISRQLAVLGTQRTAPKTNKDVVMEIIGDIQNAYEKKGAPDDVIPTGFKSLDDSLGGGMRGDDMILLTGPTKGGKSILAQNIAENVWFSGGRPTLIISLEMSSKSLFQRILASQSKTSLTRMRRGWLVDRDISAIAAHSSKVAESKITVRSDVNSLFQIVSICRAMKAKHANLGAIVVDYAQLIRRPQGKNENREQVVADISTTLRGLNLELGVPLILLAQENKQGDARESSRLEQDCTMRLKIEKVYDAQKNEDDTVRNIAIPLARNGPPCEFKLTFRGDLARFENHCVEPTQ